MTEPATPAAAPAGTIHDLGYKRYVGTRRPQSTRWRVIARNQIATAWKTFWRFKLALLLGVITTAVVSIIIAVGGGLGEIMRQLSSGSPGDAIAALSYPWFARVAFIASMTLAASSIANDNQTGAFTFYFARPVRPADYVAGKVGGMFLLFLVLLLAGPLIVAGVRLGTYRSGTEALHHLDILPKVLLIGVVSALAYAAVPLAFSALAPSRRYALAMWAAYYIVVGSIAQLVGFTGSPAVAGLDLPSATQSMAFELFDVHFMRGKGIVPLPYAMIGLLGQAAAAIAIIFFRVRSAQRSGVGGSG